MYLEHTRARAAGVVALVALAGVAVVPAASAQDSTAATLFTRLHERNRTLADTPQMFGPTLGVNAATIKEVGQLTSAKRWKLNTPDGMQVSVAFQGVSGHAKDLTLRSDEVKDGLMRVRLRRMPASTGVLFVCQLDMGVHSSVLYAGKKTQLGSVARHSTPRFDTTFFPLRNVSTARADMELLIQPAARYATTKPVAKLPQGALCKIFTYPLPRMLKVPASKLQR